ncbi:MAG: alginate export family protein [bacterium]
MKLILVQGVFAAVILALPTILFSQTGVSFSGDLRVRAEARQNADFNSQLGDQAVFVAQRARATLEWQFPEHLQALLQIQDARLWGEEGSTNRALNNTDLHQAYFDVEKLFGKSLVLRVGRQQLAFGNERLVGKYDWDQAGRAFDAARLTWGEAGQKIDFWLAQNRNKNATGINSNQEFMGAYFATQRLYKTTAEVYAMAVLDDRDFPIGSTTGKSLFLIATGARLAGKLHERWHYDLEGVYQFGDHGDLKVQAFGMAVEGRWLVARRYAPTVSVSYVFGSGDSNPFDEKLGTLSALFPSIHEHLGAMDYVSWSNIAATVAAFELRPARGLALQSQWHYFQLAHGNDAWYGAQGFNFDRRSEIFLPALPGESIVLGSEIDLSCSYTVRERIQLYCGLSRFFPGGFVKAGNPEADASDWGFLSLQMHF